MTGPKGRTGRSGINGTPGIPGVGGWTINGTMPNEILIPPTITGNWNTRIDIAGFEVVRFFVLFKIQT